MKSILSTAELLLHKIDKELNKGNEELDVALWESEINRRKLQEFIYQLQDFISNKHN